MGLNSRGQVQTIAPAVLILVFAAVVLVFGLIITQEIRDTPIVANGLTQSNVNESTTTVVNETGVAVSVSGSSGFTGFSIDSITAQVNGTGTHFVLTTTGNYTTNASGYVFFAGDTDEGFNNTAWNLSYTWTEWGQSADAANLTVVGLGTFADFWEIIVLAIIISVVIGLLLVVFGRNSRR